MAAVDVKTNGELSRMRSHKGNAPTLPQDKSCPVCPARFTRTTHLHRHLRSHTNERSYKCERCSAEFTRSDLLTRHKKTCGDPAMQRSRRKSCQACAESKVKCDLQLPCSKCIARGKNCVFVNDPAISRDKRSQSEKRSRSAEDEIRTIRSQTSTPSPLEGFSSLYSEYSPSSSSNSSTYDSSQSSPQTPPDNYIIHDPASIVPSLDITKFFPNDVFSGDTQSADDAAWWDGALGRSYFLKSPMYTPSVAEAMDISSVYSTPRHGDTIPKAELDHYLYLFFETFSVELPIVHRHTWESGDKHPLLLRAMQACGALFVKTRQALRFILETISTTRDVVMDEFTFASPRQQDYLMLAVSLLQTIGLFHQDVEVRDSSTAWHSILVIMIRHSSAMDRSQSWPLPDLDDLQTVEYAWKDWGTHESIKRGLLLAYLHDCCHCIFFATTPSLQSHELNLNLPCDEAQWNARSPMEWYAASGGGPSRVLGQPLMPTLNALAEARLSSSLPPHNRFSMFILMHGILRNMYCTLQRSTDMGGFSGLPISGPQFAFQFVLHNWMQTWSLSCGIRNQHDQDMDNIPFAYDVLPFYWLAQVSLLAIQSGSADCIRGLTSTRFCMMKEWLYRIRSLLRANNGAPPDLWKELMLIRHKAAAIDAAAALSNSSNGLVSFFASC